MVSEMETTINNNNKNSMMASNDSVNDEGYDNSSSDIQQQQMQTVHAPQTVGVEFVRQYYTILNKAPNLLYRFYSEDSTLIHGCLDIAGSNTKIYKGRKQIDAKITSMNFKDCHTKIRQVDSMETMGYGVVIQVIGELSNNGQPMRSFLQTFVLAPNKSPNKYYVRNDIFRYQDVYDDEIECSQEIFDEEKSELDDGNDVKNQIEDHQQQQHYLPLDNNETNENNNFAYNKQQQQNGDTENVVVDVEKNLSPGPGKMATTSLTSKIQQQPNLINEIDQSSLQPQQNIVQETSKPVPIVEESMKESLEQEHIDDEHENIAENNSNNLNDNNDDCPKPTTVTNSVSPSAVSASAVVNEPKTYAGILGRASQGAATSVVAGAGSTGQAKPTAIDQSSASSFIGDNQQPSINAVATNSMIGGGPTIVGSITKTTPPSFSATNVSINNNSNTQSQPSSHRFRKTYNRRNDSKESGKNNDSDSGGDIGEHHQQSSHFINSNLKKYPDENQLFIGNLLPDFSEDVLHKIFGKYGKILDIRINRQKMPNSKNRNYGFITFDRPEVVDQIIALKPIYHENHRYNVEKKQGKSGNVSYSSGGGSGGNRDRGNSNMTRNNNQSSNAMSTGSGGRHVLSTSGAGSNNNSQASATTGQQRGNRTGGDNYRSSSSNSSGNNPQTNKGTGGSGQQHFPNRQIFNQQQSNR